MTEQELGGSLRFPNEPIGSIEYSVAYDRHSPVLNYDRTADAIRHAARPDLPTALHL